MPVAFVISSPEEQVVHAVLEGSQEPFPRLDGSLFRFRPADLPDFMKAVSAHAKSFQHGSEEYRASMRLVERLGTWLGRQIVENPTAQLDLFTPPAPEALEEPRRTLLRKLIDRTSS
jgi:hypothetical protein